MTRVFVSALLFSVAALTLAKPAAVAAVKKPNIVIIVADDLGWADVGYHGSNIETPHIDRIIAEGIQIERFYATPLCGPTRKGLYTGRSPVSLGVINNPRPSNESQSVPLEEHLISQTFKAAGYQTWMIGKWHLKKGNKP